MATFDRVRFPVGLTLAAAVVVALCCGLGDWQLGRAQWKRQQLARIAALEHAPPQPIGLVLARAAHAENVGFTRVEADCGPPEPNEAARYIPGAVASEWVWRAIAACPLGGGPNGSIVLDRGILDASRGSTAAPHVKLPPPRRVVGVLVPNTATSLSTGGGSAPYLVEVEHEDPAPPGVTPTSGLAEAAPQTLQYVGSYAPTWFGLAGVAACFYVAMLWRKHQPKR